MKRILVTGAAGFVGAAVVHQLLAKGKDVAIIVRPTSDLRRLEKKLDDVTVIHGDLFAIDDSRREIERFAPEGVAHLGWGGVSGGGRNQALQLDNLISSIQLYRLTEEIGCAYFLGLGSQAEYGIASGKIDEQLSPKPTNVYGAAKLATALVLDQMSAASGRPFAWLRLFSSYGPDDTPSYLMPYLIRSLLAGEKPALTKAEQIWDYIHVDDVASAVVASMDAEVKGIYNLGSGVGRPLQEIISMVRDLIDPALPLGFDEVPYSPNQVMHLEANIDALSNAANWAPEIGLEDGLARVVDWYREEHMREQVVGL